jgi:sulfatase maturation enzyme AslB (radical SAM superfamily)
MGVKSINLVNHENLLKGYEIACKNGVKMDVIATIGKSRVNYLRPDYEKAKKVNWMEDIKKLQQYNPSIMLIDEFLVNSFDWDFIKNILNEINKLDVFSGLITFTPFETTEKLLNSSIKDDFDFYMIPVNKYGYIMDCDSFLKEDQKRLEDLLSKLNKKIIVQKSLAVGILQPKEAFDFLKTLNFVDMIAVGIASSKEAETTFNALKEA